MTEAVNNIVSDNEQGPPMDDFEFAKSLVYEAGELIRTSLVQGNYDSTWKADNTPVTSIDIAVNKLVIDEIHRQYPGDRVYGEEESAEADGEHTGNTWVLDPIDGTQDLEQNGKAFTTCLAKVDSNGQPVFSTIYNPTTNELFAVKKGEQATLNGEPIHVSSKEQIKSSYIYLGSRIQLEGVGPNSTIYGRLEDAGGKILNYRALAYGCTQVARGLAEGALIGVKTPFEAASVKLLVENAGGKVTDLYGNEPGRLDGEIRGLVASNGLIHDQLLQSLLPQISAESPIAQVEAQTNGLYVNRVSRSIKSRTERPEMYPERFPVPDDKAAWDVGYAYAPPYFVADSVLAQDYTVKPGGWADPEDIAKLERELHSYEGEVQFDDQGHPRNPYTRTGLKGRGLLGKWGANFAADPIISRINPETGDFEVVVIERSDTHEWAIPGGMVDEGEDVFRAIEREFQEEAGASVDMSQAELVYGGYVDDPRNTDNAWMETSAKHLHLSEDLARQITLTAGDDAKAVRWLPINRDALNNLYASHGPMIKTAIKLFLNRQVGVSNDVRAKLNDVIVDQQG